MELSHTGIKGAKDAALSLLYIQMFGNDPRPIGLLCTYPLHRTHLKDPKRDRRTVSASEFHAYHSARVRRLMRP